jgi:hypothetical protein
MKTCNSSPDALKYITDLAATINAAYEAIGHGQQPSAHPMRTAGASSGGAGSGGASTSASVQGERASSHMPTYVPSGVAPATPSAPPMPPAYPVPNGGRPSTPLRHLQSTGAWVHCVLEHSVFK